MIILLLLLLQPLIIISIIMIIIVIMIIMIGRLRACHPLHAGHPRAEVGPHPAARRGPSAIYIYIYIYRERERAREREREREIERAGRRSFASRRSCRAGTASATSIWRPPLTGGARGSRTRGLRL